MSSHVINRRHLLAGIGALAAVPSATFAATTWPAGQVTLIVPVAPGGLLDLTARQMHHAWTTGIANPITSMIVENKPGAAAQLGSAYVARSAPDGSTLLVTGSSVATWKHLFPDLSFDPQKDLTQITCLCSAPHMVIVNASLPVNTVQELIKLVKSEPGRHNFGSSGVAGPTHLAGELFKLKAGIDMTHVPYAGSAPAFQDLAGNRLTAIVDTVGGALGLIKEGRLKVLGVGTEERVALFPDVPTCKEQGVDFVSGVWVGLFGPGGMAPDLAETIHARALEALGSEQSKLRFADLGYTIIGEGPAAFAKRQAAETEKWGEVVKAANIRL
jgi:tripartite-type tricarboxylate transporter receptor subunit TctC